MRFLYELSRLCVILALTLIASAATAGGLPRGTIDALYPLDCGSQIGRDRSRWMGGADHTAIRFANNCYLIRHGRDLLLWDTGIADQVVGKRGGVSAANGALTLYRTSRLSDQLRDLGVKPGQIRYVALSHAHVDHTGNADEFSRATLLIQAPELAAVFSGQGLIAQSAPKLLRYVTGNRVRRLSGNFDVFGDGSAVIYSTPGHTPGHQSLLIKLRKTGSVVLTGDVVHTASMLRRAIVPSFNDNLRASRASIEKVKAIASRTDAQIWIGHDFAQARAVLAKRVYR